MKITAKRRKGNHGEEVAFSYLKKNKYKILDRNYESRFGEIDIIAKKDKTVVFVEVKSQDAGLNKDLYPERNVNTVKMRKIIRTAEYYLIDNKYPDDTDWRVDVIGVDLDYFTRTAELRHLKNAATK